MKTETRNYWWLNTNKSIWDVSKFPVGHREPEETHNAEGNKRNVYTNFRSMRAGDLIIGYESSPTKKIVAIYKVTKGMHIASNGKEVIEFEIMEKLKRTIGWLDITSNAGLKESALVKIGNRGSIFRLTEEQYNIIKELVK